MEIMQKIAEKHGLVCLLHEKPFAGVNGSGKHNNWSLSTNTGENLLSPGKHPEDNLTFQLFLSAVIKAVDEYQDLLRATVASAGNDHRLGAHEAPPAIMSVYLGDDLGEMVESIINGEEYVSHGKEKMLTGVDVLADFKKDTSDRNRTSPFAFTGNKFEFRALGSSLNIGCPNYMLNTMVAEELSRFYVELKDADDMEKAVRYLVRNVLTEHRRIIFNGDNYTDEWVEEAKRRGLLNLKSLPEAFSHFLDQKNIDLFVKEITDAALAEKALSAAIPTDVEEELIMSLSNKLVCFVRKTAELEDAVMNAAGFDGDPLARATFFRENVFAKMQEIRAVGDSMETETASEFWPYPSYTELLFSV